MPEDSECPPNDFSFMAPFSEIADPRGDRGKRHPLINVIAIAICGVICGADNWVSITTWAKAKEGWLSQLLDMSAGIPSHDTFGRVFAMLSPEEFQQAFIVWVQSLGIDVAGKVVAVDGKTLRRSHDRSSDRPAIHMVSAWCSGVGLSLGQLKTEEKSNEITAIPDLLRLLDLQGAVVTIDAMGCQRAIASTIRERGADYVLALKDNQPTLSAAVETWFDEALSDDLDAAGVTTASECNKGHGREETRTIWAAPVPESLPHREQWEGLASIVWVESVRAVGGKTSFFQRFFLSSMPSDDPGELLRVVRTHWSIENELHWVLDMAFREDESRARIGNSAENLARLRQFALAMLKRERTLKVGINIKRLRAGWDDAYLAKVMVGAA